MDQVRVRTMVRCVTSCFARALVIIVGIASAVAQERVDFPRYSIDLPAGWSSRVEGERRVIYPAADENDCVIAPVAMDTSANLAGGEARRQMWSTVTSGRRVLRANATQESRDPGGRTWTVDSAVIEQGGGVYVLARVRQRWRRRRRVTRRSRQRSRVRSGLRSRAASPACGPPRRTNCDGIWAGRPTSPSFRS